MWNFCSIVFYVLTLKMPLQTSLSVMAKLTVCVRPGEKFMKTSTSQDMKQPSSAADPGFSPGGAPTPKIAIIFQTFAENT